jgi:hypothetical protein
MYVGTAAFTLATHIGDKFAPSTIGGWIRFMHLEAMWVTLFVSPLVSLATVCILLPSYLLFKKQR